ncbi:SDR family oxidoreductase [Pontibacter qinzhouensis]|uniref:NADP-dependent 3-hydroxy acid dehydrogenase YdfG n=1 Tax=Pontibacter qinzhouensis TaxID=2603253 RepID=A0A5C8K836_9BACT|nr:SDR family oxidoreductase [Pontibacter qinzhouensis]TXK46362.1 SDR family oxidoreductase [Pontibacter qinzhouensis]
MIEAKRYSLVTGASTGIGKAIAEECAKRKQNLILVSLPESGLHEVGKTLQQHYEVDVRTVELNLIQPHAVNELYDWCCRQELAIDVLINNAGMGNYSPFSSTEPETYLNIVRLNAEVVVLMTNIFLPKLREHRESYVLNVGSFVSFLPIPYKSVYSASKSFVLTFSKALHSELDQYGVHVSCLCPGPTLTETVKKRNQLLLSQNSDLLSLSPEVVAKVAIDGLFKRKRVIIPGWKNKFILSLIPLLPFRLKSYILKAIFKNGFEKEEKRPLNKTDEQKASVH